MYLLLWQNLNIIFDLSFSTFLSLSKALALLDPGRYFDTLENILKIQADNG